MLKFEEPYIVATMHDCKNNLSRLLRILRDSDNNYRGVVIRKGDDIVGMLVPMNISGQQSAVVDMLGGLGPLEE